MSDNNVVDLNEYRQRKLSEQFDRIEEAKKRHPAYKPKDEDKNDAK